MVGRGAGEALAVAPRPRARRRGPIDQSRSRACLVAARACGASAASRAAIARASLASASAGTTRRDEPEPLGVRGADSVSPRSASSAALAGPTRRGRNHVAPLSGHEPDPPEREHEARASARDPEVAGERERRAGAGRDAVDRPDDRLVERAHRADDRVVALAQLDGERRGVGLEPLLEVLAGAERAARHRSGRRPGSTGRARSRRKARQQLDLHRDGQRVERLGPVERDGRDRVGDVEPDVAEAGVAARRHQAAADPDELDQAAVDELEDPPVDRLVGAARLLDDELREQRGELVRRRGAASRRSAGAARGGRSGSVRAAPSSVARCADDLGQQDPGGVPAVARCPS